MAGRKRQALPLVLTILVVALGLAALWWHSAQTVGPIRAPQKPRQATVQALWYSPGQTGASEGTSRVVVRVEPNDVPGVRVGFYEDEAQGSGETWRASGWMAAVVASLTAGIDLRQYVPSFTVEGRIDGPSAGGLLAVGVLACLTDADLNPKATLTGAIHPDGSIGPVGGVAHKIDAAAAAGMKLVLIPRGQREEKDPETGQMVDVMERGRLKKVRVVEVEDVAEAYARLTGRTLPQPEAEPEQPKLPEPVAKELASRAATWLATYEREATEGARLRGRLQGIAGQVDDQVVAAQAAAKRAKQRLAEGNVAAGYDQAVMATLQASTTLDLLQAIGSLNRNGVGEAIRTVAPPQDRPAEISLTLRQLSDLSVDTVDGLLATADAFGTTAQAAGLLRARAGLQTALEAAPNEAGSAGLLLRAATLKGLDRHILEIAQDRVRLVASRDGPKLQREAQLTAWASTMERAAGADLGYFRAVAIDEAARSVGVHPDLLRASIEYGDATYLLAQASLAALPDLAVSIQGKPRNDAAILGASVGAYAAGSALVTKFCSLQVEVNRNGEVVGIADPQALERLVKSAEARAVRDIAAAQAAGLEASLPTFYYLIAGQYAGGDTDERLEALQCYWQASLYARVGRLLAR
ncbi:MAG: hypothetical protein FJX75_23625 [Armatimonadetes bacterium]|nr:hypothetical protein [Armatimonadota bacterium]